MTDAIEQQLVQQAGGDAAAFGQLYDRTVDRIYAYAYRQTQDVAAAQDVTAVTYEKALRHLQKHGWRGDSAIAWLYRITYNEAMQHHRKRRWLRPLSTFTPSPNQHERQPETAVQQHESQHLLHQALAQLAQRDRDVLTLRFLEGLSPEETAVVLGCSTDNVYVRLHRALKRLRHKMDTLTQSREVTYVSR